MTRTVIGVVTDTIGHAMSTRDGHWATPSNAIAHRQPAVIPIDVEHDHVQRGQVVHLEIDNGGRLWAVGHLTDPQVSETISVRVGEEVRSVPSPLFWSPARSRDKTDITFYALSLTTSPSRINPRPVRILDGDLQWLREPPRAWRSKVSAPEFELLERATTAYRTRPRDTPLIVSGAETGELETQYRGPRDTFEKGPLVSGSILRVS